MLHFRKKLIRLEKKNCLRNRDEFREWRSFLSLVLFRSPGIFVCYFLGAFLNIHHLVLIPELLAISFPTGSFAQGAKWLGENHEVERNPFFGGISFSPFWRKICWVVRMSNWCCVNSPYIFGSTFGCHDSPVIEVVFGRKWQQLIQFTNGEADSFHSKVQWYAVLKQGPIRLFKGFLKTPSPLTSRSSPKVVRKQIESDGKVFKPRIDWEIFPSKSIVKKDMWMISIWESVTRLFLSHDPHLMQVDDSWDQLVVISFLQRNPVPRPFR